MERLGIEIREIKSDEKVLNDFMNTSKMVIRDMSKSQALSEKLQDYTNHYRKIF